MPNRLKLSIIIEEVFVTQFAFEQVHPGAVLREELKARGLSANAFALKLRGEKWMLKRVQHDEPCIDMTR